VEWFCVEELALLSLFPLNDLLDLQFIQNNIPFIRVIVQTNSKCVTVNSSNTDGGWGQAVA
jgi:hypothetical protein